MSAASLGDIDRLTESEEVLELPVAKIKIKLLDLKTRQFFKLLKILTTGAGELIAQLRLDPDETEDTFVRQLLAIVVLSIPEAEDEALEFLLSMIEPAEVVSGRLLSKDQKQKNDDARAQLVAEFENPELEDAIYVIEKIIRKESKDIQGLGKRLAGMLDLAEKTGQLPISTES